MLVNRHGVGVAWARADSWCVDADVGFGELYARVGGLSQHPLRRGIARLNDLGVSSRNM
jgi:hypothetical protein